MCVCACVVYINPRSWTDDVFDYSICSCLEEVELNSQRQVMLDMDLNTSRTFILSVSVHSSH